MESTSGILSSLERGEGVVVTCSNGQWLNALCPRAVRRLKPLLFCRNGQCDRCPEHSRRKASSSPSTFPFPSPMIYDMPLFCHSRYQNPAPVATAVGDPGTGTVNKPPLAVAITGGPGLALPGPLGGGVGGVQFGGAPTDEKPPHSAAAAGGGGGTMSGHNINEMGVAAAHHQFYQNGAGAGLVPAAVTGMSLAPNGRRSGGGGMLFILPCRSLMLFVM